MRKFLTQNRWLLVVVLFAAFFRFYSLGSLPAGLTWDEAAIGYNGYAIITTRRDEWLERLPISFRSFGDYKAPLAIYMTGVFTYILGLTPFVVRFPFAVSGVVAIVAFYFVSNKLFEGVKNSKFFALITTFLLALSPWHIHFTRVGFESGLALTLTLLGLWVLFEFFKSLESQVSWYISALFGSLSGVLFVSSLYAYHSSKIVVPLLVLLTIAIFARFKIYFLMSHWKGIIVPLFISSAAVWPLVRDMLYAQGGARAAVLIFSEKLTVSEYAQIIAQNFTLHLSPLFLLNGATNTLRHGTGIWGVLFLTTYLLSFIGLLGYILSVIYRKNSLQTRVGLWSICTIIIGLLPAVLTREVPHPNRALFALPGFLLLATLGLYYLLEWIRRFKNYDDYHLRNLVIGTFLLLHCTLFITFWQYYTVTYPTRSSESFTEGYVEAFALAQEYEKGQNGKREVEKILFSSEYGQPYIYALFVRRTNPIWYRGGSLVKYEFTEKIAEGDLARNNTLIVATKNNLLTEHEPDHILYGGDGSIRFAFYLTPVNAAESE